MKIYYKARLVRTGTYRQVTITTSQLLELVLEEETKHLGALCCIEYAADAVLGIYICSSPTTRTCIHRVIHFKYTAHAVGKSTDDSILAVIYRSSQEVCKMKNGQRCSDSRGRKKKKVVESYPILPYRIVSYPFLSYPIL